MKKGDPQGMFPVGDFLRIDAQAVGINRNFRKRAA
jgi:hypothetical protein